MKKRTGLTAAFLLISGILCSAAAPIAILKAGTYTAIVSSLVCGACAPQVEKTLKEYPGIAAATVDQEKSTVKFTVKQGASVKVANLQAELESASAEMGMGADYTLKSIRSVDRASANDQEASKYKLYKTLTSGDQTYRYNERGEPIAPSSESAEKSAHHSHLTAPKIRAAEKAGAQQHAAAAKAAYVCPMGHYSSEQPGTCPKCGMELQKAQ